MSHRIKVDELTQWRIHINDGELLTKDQILENERKTQMNFVEAFAIVTSQLRDDAIFRKNFFTTLANCTLEELMLIEDMDLSAAQLAASNASLSFINTLTQTENKTDELHMGRDNAKG